MVPSMSVAIERRGRQRPLRLLNMPVRLPFTACPHGKRRSLQRKVPPQSKRSQRRTHPTMQDSLQLRRNSQPRTRPSALEPRTPQSHINGILREQIQAYSLLWASMYLSPAQISASQRKGSKNGENRCSTNRREAFTFEDAIGALHLSHVATYLFHVFLCQAGNRRHVPKSPMVARNTATSCVAKAGIRMMARVVDSVDQCRAAACSSGVDSMAQRAVGVEQSLSRDSHAG